LAQSRHLRHRCDLHARYAPEGHPPRPARVLELSLQGAFVAELGLPECQVGDRGALSLALPSGDVLTLPVRVTRLGRARREVSKQGVDNVTVSAFGCGVEFDGAPPPHLAQLHDYLDLLDGR
jgi:hypothetical protein